MLTATAALLYGVMGCGGGSSNSSIPNTNTGTQNGGGSVEQGSPQISGLVRTADASISSNGALVTLEGATVILNDDKGVTVGQVQSTPYGYNLAAPRGGAYTVVPMPFKVGDVTLTAPSQQVILAAEGIKAMGTVNITYTRQQ